MWKILLLIISLLLLAGCNTTSVNHNIKIEESINSVLKEGKSAEIDLNSFTDFTWTKAFVFPPYTTQENINRQLGIKFQDTNRIEVRDDIHLLLFLTDEKAIQYAEISRAYADFSVVDTEVFTPSTATIKIKQK